MSETIRLGLIAEREIELETSISYIKPEDGGKVITREHEGILHNLIRKKLQSLGLPDCDFVQRHPSIRNNKSQQLLTQNSIINTKYLAQRILSWKPEEVDMIMIAFHPRDKFEQKKIDWESALNQIRDNYYLDVNTKSSSLSINNYDTVLLAKTLILEELEDEIRWDATFARSQDTLAQLAAEAMTEYRAGKTEELDPKTL